MSYFGKRKLEWVCAIMLAAIGTIMYLQPDAFLSTRLTSFAENSLFWTYACMAVGYGRVVALTINGHWKGGTPAIRLVGSIMGAGIFGAFVGNIIQSTASTGLSWSVGTYSVLMFGELLSSYNSAKDMTSHAKYGS